MSQKHIFALHVNAPLTSGLYTVTDVDFAHRVRNVLRLEVGQCVQLFTRMHHAEAQVVEFKKKDTVLFSIASVQENVLPADVTFLLPVLKFGDLSDAVYALAEVGVKSIQLVYTQKSQHTLQAAQFEKLERVVIAAAEQSKSFSYAELFRPVDLEVACAQLPAGTCKLYADISGIAAKQWTLQVAGASRVVVLVGPEGDLASQEKDFVKQQQFVFVRLTSSVLRAVQAVALLAGMVNCFIVER